MILCHKLCATPKKKITISGCNKARKMCARHRAARGYRTKMLSCFILQLHIGHMIFILCIVKLRTAVESYKHAYSSNHVFGVIELVSSRRHPRHLRSWPWTSTRSRRFVDTSESCQSQASTLSLLSFQRTRVWKTSLFLSKK